MYDFEDKDLQFSKTNYFTHFIFQADFWHVIQTRNTKVATPKRDEASMHQGWRQEFRNANII